MARLTVVADEEAVAASGAERIANLVTQSIEQRGRALLCLTGGRTPRKMYERLATVPLDWPRVHLFWSDERHVPSDHPDSNFGMAHQALISRVPIPPANVHRIPAALPDADAAARAYEAEIRDVTFDVMLLGLGEDGHIASLFPNASLTSPLLVGRGLAPRQAGREDPPYVSSAEASLPPYVTRVTLTPRALLNARTILVLVTGAAKASAVEAALKAADDVARWPVHLLRAADDRVEWLIDEAAGSRL